MVTEMSKIYLIEISNCVNGFVRLVGGNDTNEGRVEICSNGVWGTIYSGGWDIHDATVACRQLGLYQPYSSMYCVLQLIMLRGSQVFIISIYIYYRSRGIL